MNLVFQSLNSSCFNCSSSGTCATCGPNCQNLVSMCSQNETCSSVNYFGINTIECVKCINNEFTGVTCTTDTGASTTSPVVSTTLVVQSTSTDITSTQTALITASSSSSISFSINTSNMLSETPSSSISLTTTMPIITAEVSTPFSLATHSMISTTVSSSVSLTTVMPTETSVTSFPFFDFNKQIDNLIINKSINDPDKAIELIDLIGSSLLNISLLNTASLETAASVFNLINSLLNMPLSNSIIYKSHLNSNSSAK